MLAFASAVPLSAARAPPLRLASRPPHTRLARRRQRAPCATLPAPPPVALDGLLLSVNELYAQIAKGGIGIIMSGVVGAIITGALIKRNYDFVRSARTPSLA